MPPSDALATPQVPAGVQGRLGAGERAAALGRLAQETFDLLVIGGGVTGCGVALDAAARGLSVALVEARDLAAGTSSRSSKLIHGGLRYLEQRNVALVREALGERTRLLTRLAPHLVRPVRFLYPLTHRVWERGYAGAGVLLYDTLAGHTGLPRHQHLTRRGALKAAPALRHDALVGGILYSDAQVDDARHTLAVARSAARFGAAVATSTRAVGFLFEGERVAGAVVRDLEGGAEIPVRARQVVNATGVWADEVQAFAGRGRLKVQASKGIHLVVPRDRVHADVGLILRTATSVLFVIPWGRHWIIGTTDTAWGLGKAHPAASRTDIDYLLDHVNGVLRVPLTRSDVEGVYAGLRPLLAGESDSTSRLSREHAVVQGVSGLITVAGGKYTTYRVMARDAVDVAARGLDQRVPESPTADLPLHGADGFAALWNARHRLAEEHGLHVARVEHLLRRHGSDAPALLSTITTTHPSGGYPDLAAPLPGADDYLAVEAWWAAAAEGALHLDDVLTRRTRISIETWDRGLAAADTVARIMGGVLGWSAATRELEITHYRARVSAERESQQQPDDHTADAARMGAGDVRTGFTSSGAPSLDR